MAAKPSITIKETKLINGIAQGKKRRHAARAAGYTGSDEVVSVTASKVLAKANVKEALELALVKHGITLDAAIEPISKALTATKVVITGNDTDGHFAEVVEDLDMQLKGSDRALKLMGVGKEEGGVNITFINQVREKKDLYDL